MKQLFKKLSPKKKIRCSSCNTRFQFPVKPGKTLKVTCPSCGAVYEVSFVNPLVELVKGNLKWKTMSGIDKRNSGCCNYDFSHGVGVDFIILKITDYTNNYAARITENLCYLKSLF